MTTPPSGGAGPVVRRTVNPAMITSDFESQSHEQLRAMIESADAGKTRDLGDRLKAAGVAINKIGEDLRTYMSHVNWEGEAGDAFRTWGANMVNATTRLGEFSDKAGTWMGHAAETLSTVKSAMPEYSATSKATLNDYLSHHPGGFLLKPPANSDAPKPGGGVLAGPTPEAAAAAQKRLDEDHAEAVRLMRQLAGSYVWSAHNMGQVERPQFQPIRPDHLPPPHLEDLEHISGPGAAASPGPGLAPGSSPTGQRAYEGVEGQASNATSASTYGTGYGSGTNTVTASVPSALPNTLPVSMDVDGGVVAPAIPTSPPGGTVGPYRDGGSLDQTQSLSGMPVMPSANPTAIGPTAPSRSRVGTVVGMPGPGAFGGAVPKQGTVGGTIPGQGVVSGRASVPSVGGPNDGIVGGRPTVRTPVPTSAQVPRGTVIGTEPGSSRPPMGPGFGGAMPGASGGSAGRTGGSGRRLATEAGGVVGGSAQVRPGAVDRPFTQGGTGLVRNQGQTQASRGTSRQGQHEGRPDYLIEDGGAWQNANRQVVPPVID